MSNVKAGDLCVIARVFNERDEEHVGRVVTCVSRYVDDGWPLWRVEPSIPPHPGVYEPCLKPILPPPGTVTSDEVKELYAPKAKETA